VEGPPNVISRKKDSLKKSHISETPCHGEKCKTAQRDQKQPAERNISPRKGNTNAGQGIPTEEGTYCSCKIIARKNLAPPGLPRFRGFSKNYRGEWKEGGAQGKSHKLLGSEAVKNAYNRL